MKDRSPIKNLVFTFLHWVLVVLLSVISFFIQYAFLIDTNESHFDYIFSGSVMRINWWTFSFGIILFLLGFILLWKKFLVVDWNSFQKYLWVWKMAYIIIALGSLAAIFVAGILIHFLHVGLGNVITPQWTTWGCIALPVYVVLVIVVDFGVCKLKQKNG